MRTALRAAVGFVLAIALAWPVCLAVVRPQYAYQSLRMVAEFLGPGLLVSAAPLARYIVRIRATWFEAAFFGMAAGLASLLAFMLLLAPFQPAYAFAFGFALLAPALAGGAGLGLGCRIAMGARP